MTTSALRHNRFLVETAARDIDPHPWLYDLRELDGDEKVLLSRPLEKSSRLARGLRVLTLAGFAPFTLRLADAAGDLALTVRQKSFSFSSYRPEVFDAQDRLIGSFRPRTASPSRFDILDHEQRVIGTLKNPGPGLFHSKTLQLHFKQDDAEIAILKKNRVGTIWQEMTPDNHFLLEISPSVPENAPIRSMILAAAVCLDLGLQQTLLASLI